MVATLAPASTLDLERLAGLFTAGYAGYWHPIELDATALERMVRTYDLDLAASRLALAGDGVPVGLALLGRRGAEGWVGGMAVVPEARGAGLGELLTRGLLDAAQERGVSSVRLEVLEQNAPALAIYRRVGFAHLRDVAVWRLSSATSGPAADEIDLDEALAALAAGGLDAPWQRSLATVARLREAETALVGLRAGAGHAVCSVADGRAALLELAASEPDEADALLRSPFARGATELLWLNGPVDGLRAAALDRAGAVELARQHELRVSL